MPTTRADPSDQAATSNATPLCSYETMLKRRKLRNELFGADLFGEPAWEIMLLLGHEAGQNGASLEALAPCISCAVSTLSRWMALLVARGHVLAIAGETPHYRLSDQGQQKLVQLFA